MVWFSCGMTCRRLEAGGWLCLTYSNMSTGGTGETIQQNKGGMEGEKRWSIFSKFRHRDDHCIGPSEPQSVSLFQQRTRIADTWVDFASKHANTKCLLPLLHRVPTTSALGGAKVDMSTIHTNYKNPLWECHTIVDRFCPKSTRHTKIRLLINSVRRKDTNVDSFQINL